MSDEPRSPLHPKALTTKELTLERRILRFNLHDGVRGEYFVASAPYEHDGSWAVDLTNAESGNRMTHYLGDLGVAPYCTGSFNTVDFVVDPSDRHMLPTELVRDI